jgi:hypothetical protein
LGDEVPVPIRPTTASAVRLLRYLQCAHLISSRHP